MRTCRCRAGAACAASKPTGSRWCAGECLRWRLRSGVPGRGRYLEMRIVAASVTVAIPVRDGGELLAGTLAALARQTVEHELLVCDSGSHDGSVALARAHGARVLEIEPARLQPRRHAQPADARGRGRARGAAHPGRRAGGRALAGAAARGLRAGGGRGHRLRPLPPAAAAPRRRCGSSWSAGSPRSRPTACPRVERLREAERAPAGARR